ncbi:SDR family oxidoreductase [Kineosporia sp. A_224]|uniref:SDR family NAD(P)-dependent oxidoreductase n=1 Tax=Kineosporia sp. A_224 TaxID=1962180 RepID=UPI000B4B3A58|nr:SDR family oxidoreductase [Kineosporia sp. A_224]
MPTPRTGRPVALVTGATAGIGNAFARRLAADGHDLVLVARDAVRLGEVKEQLRAAHGVEVEVISADLTDRAQLERVADRVRDAARPVDVLVNNAGFGPKQRIHEGDVDVEERLVAIMVTAVLVLTHAALPGMVARGRGTVVTVSSVAGFMPGGTYSAAKAWATTFTASVAAQTAGTGVRAVALCPGFVRTEFHQRAGLTMTSMPSWAWLDADALVDACLRDVAKGKVVSVPSVRYKAAVLALRHMPLALQQRIGRSRSSRRAENKV